MLLNGKKMTAVKGHAKVRDLAIGATALIPAYRLYVDESGNVYLNLEAKTRALKSGWFGRFLARRWSAVLVKRISETEFEVDLKFVEPERPWQTYSTMPPAMVKVGQVEVTEAKPKEEKA